MSTLALLFTDVVDSAQTVERLGDEAAARLWAEHDRHARDLLVPHRGREIDRTDGFFLVFDQAADAAAYALGYHAMLAALGWHARAGLHVGPVRLRTNPPQDVARGAKPLEVEGLAKPMAARIMSLAQAGQTLLSAAAREALEGRAPANAEIQRHGTYRFKGIEAPVEIFEVGRRGTAPFTPPGESDKCHQVVQVEGRWQPLCSVPHNLPAERDAFVGRSDEIGRLVNRLDRGTRLLTVVGPGGVGKTRLVRRYGWNWLGEWPGGVYFCDLSDCYSVDALYFVVATALEVPLGREDPARQIGHAIAGRGRCLLILDNFEQLIAHASATVGPWLERAPQATFLVTSREHLHLSGESVLLLEPLSRDDESVELFRVRASARRPDFALTAANRPLVEQIVRLLDGLPLAIELAATRVAVLSPAQLLERLKDRFRVLASSGGAATRQATLRNTIDWSWTLLAAWEQAALMQCAAFEGGFSLAAAEAVVDLQGWPESPATLDVVQALVDKSLLRSWIPVETGRDDLDEPYFGMYVSIREYARQKLRAAGGDVEQAAEDRHGRYFASMGSDEAIEVLSRHEGVARRRALMQELDNLIVACRRAIAQRQSETAVSTYRAAWEVLELQGPVGIGVELGRALATLEGLSDPLLHKALLTVALPLHRAGRVDEARDCLEHALVVARRLGDRRGEGLVLGHLGTLHRDQGRGEQALACLLTALELDRQTGDKRAEGAVLGNLGNLYLEQGNMAEARRCYESALAINTEIGNRRLEGSVLGNLGLLHFDQGRLDDAQSHFEAALAVHREVGSRRFEGTVLGNLALLHTEQGRRDEAKACHEAALVIHRAVGNRRDECIVLVNLGELLLDMGELPQAQDNLSAARTIAREIGYQRAEGAAQGYLGELLAAQGRIDESRQVLREGEGLLRAAADRLALGKLLCAKARVEHANGAGEQARAALAEATSLAVAAGAGPDSELGRELRELGSRIRLDAGAGS